MDKVMEVLDTVMATVSADKRVLWCLLFLGIWSGLTIFHDVVRMVWSMFFRPGKDIKRVFGNWAVVTGATDGIGKAMAFEFARKGCNVVIISRTQSKLDECAKEITAKYPKVEVKVLAIDFGKFDAAARAKVTALLAGLEVGVLVNNVGVSYPYPQYYNELTDERVEELITLNVNSTSWMTRIVLPNMLARKKGAIVNMSSAAGVTVSPMLAGYSGAKGYITRFSQSLNAELRGKGVHVQCQVPLFVATKLAKIRHASLMVPSPSGYARSAVAAIGYDSVISPYWTHMLQLAAMNAMPSWLFNKVVFNMHADLRKRGMKKEGKQA